MKPDVKKLVILNLPYLIFVYLFGKCGQAYRLAAGAALSGKLLHRADGFTVAFANPLPSLHLFDFCVGVAVVSDHVNQPKERSGKITKYCVHVF